MLAEIWINQLALGAALDKEVVEVRMLTSVTVSSELL